MQLFVGVMNVTPNMSICFQMALCGHAMNCNTLKIPRLDM